MVIRNILDSDVNQIYAIEKESFSSPWSREAILSEVSSERSHYMVVEIDGEIIAYAGLWKIFDEGHITNIAVKDSYRNKGVGKGLMSSLLTNTAKIGIDSFTLEVRRSNIGAIKLYESLGFEVAGIRKNFYDKPNEDALIMWKHNNTL